MFRMLLVNLPVTDLAASTPFYPAIGFTKIPLWSDETARRAEVSVHERP